MFFADQLLSKMAPNATIMQEIKGESALPGINRKLTGKVF